VTTLRSAMRLASVAAALLLSSATVLAAPAAGATTVGFADCFGTTHDTYTPGLTFQPQNVYFFAADTYTGCTSSDPTLTAGSDTFADVLTMSCAQPVVVGSFPLVVQWNNRRSSTLSLNATVLSETAGQIVVAATGTVTAGEFSGAAVTAQWTQVAPNPLQCLLGGVKTAVGTASLQITAA
jgi:hypothetical protein